MSWIIRGGPRDVGGTPLADAAGSLGGRFVLDAGWGSGLLVEADFAESLWV